MQPSNNPILEPLTCVRASLSQIYHLLCRWYHPVLKALCSGTQWSLLCHIEDNGISNCFYILLMCRGFYCYCFWVHKYFKSMPLIVLNATLGHLHIVSPHNLPSAGWMAHSAVLKVVEQYSSLPQITIGFPPVVLQMSIFHVLSPRSTWTWWGMVWLCLCEEQLIVTLTDFPRCRQPCLYVFRCIHLHLH